MGEPKFFICTHCGNIVELIYDAGIPLMCCGQKMQKILPEKIDATREKHVPVVNLENNSITVNVGSINHPMTDDHKIQWICLRTNKGVYRKCLETNSEPSAIFSLNDEVPISVFAYCNLHGLWKKDLT